MYTLSDVDRQAVELFLESRRGQDRDEGGRIIARPAEVSPRIEAIVRLFDALGSMAVTEPPGDLVNRVVKAAERRPAKWQAGQLPPGEPPVARQGM